MGTITYDKFDVGLDVRRGRAVSDANRCFVLTNAYITTGKTIQKRPCARKIAVLEGGTVGLRAGNGKLNTFHESGSIIHANSLFQANKLSHPTLSQAIRRIHYGEVFLGFLYVSAEYADGSVVHHYLDGASPTHVADVNCPNSKGVIKAASHIFAVDGDVVGFCAAGDPRDWTTASDAGFLAVGIQQDGDTTAYALGQFQKQLVVFFIDGAQVWNVDEDPTLNAIAQKIYALGTQHPRSPASFASDVVFLSEAGFRSITISKQTENLQDSDVGSPIDALVKGTVGNLIPMSIFVPGLGQLWTVLGNTVWVYSFSRSAKLAAWSKYTFPFTIDDITALNTKLYLRSGDNVYEVVEGIYTDDGALVNVEVELAFLDQKKPGYLKQFMGVDFIGQGTAQHQVRYDPLNPNLITDAMPLTGVTDPGTMNPVEVTATHIAPVLTHAANEDFRIDSLKYYYEDLAPL